ncbi:exo-alpha-sialidase [Desulfosporosinus acidiphilus]|nr:exo-alpha-sialidase [Desulfosporosinus acidiphilus]
MVNAMTGWALSQGSLLRTVDGGASWTNVTPKGVDSTSVGTLLSYDAQTLWVVFNKESSTSITVYHTTDGGQKWESAEINTAPYYGRVTSLDFIDLTHGWLLASYDVSMGSESVEVFQSNDGGASWKSNASAILNEKPSNALPLAGSKNGLVFSNQKNGWLTGFSHGDGIWLYSSSDGGRTWSQKTIVTPQGYHTDGGAVSTEPPHFFNQKEGVLPVEFRGENPPAFVFYRTEDGGLSWTPTTPVQTAQESQEYRGFHWSIIDATHAFVSDGY